MQVGREREQSLCVCQGYLKDEEIIEICARLEQAEEERWERDVSACILCPQERGHPSLLPGFSLAWEGEC